MGRALILNIVMGLVLFASQPSFGACRKDDNPTQAIAEACSKSSTFDACRSKFSRYSRVDNEYNINGSANLFNLFKASDLTFSGYAQEIYYTEIVSNCVEYQVGFGYIVTAHQQDASPSGAGTISGAQASGNADIGATTFTASVIGLASDAISCPTKLPANAPADQALLCGVDINPTVSQDYFKSEVYSLSSALKLWMDNQTTQLICPQIINYRSADPAEKRKRPILSEAQIDDFKNIQKNISDRCTAKTPNVHIHYRNGPPLYVSTASLSIAGATATSSRTALGQGYYRSRYYWAQTGGANNPLYDPTDRYAEVYIDGLNASASLPSVLAVIVTLNTSLQRQQIHVLSTCAGGAKAIKLDPLDPPDASKNSPVARAASFGAFLQELRAATDGAQPCN